jgi:hypothetical protein
MLGRNFFKCYLKSLEWIILTYNLLFQPYVCSICGKGYAHKTKLESHQVIFQTRYQLTPIFWLQKKFQTQNTAL